MATEMDPDKIAKKLRDVLSSRIESARSLAESKEHADQAREDAKRALACLNEAEQEETRRYRQAIDSGWTENDLQQAGLTDAATQPTQARVRHGRNPGFNPLPLPACNPPTEDRTHRS